MLSGVISKAAAFGFLRICFSLFGGPVDDFRTPILILSATGLVYGSLMAFRAPDIRGVIAYSSLAQMGLIMLGLFATNSLGINGAVLQMVNHGLISATLFLLAGAVERRDGDGRVLRARRDGEGPADPRHRADDDRRDRARGARLGRVRGRVRDPRGRLQQGWGYAVVGAIAIVLAAMYVLRLISAVLHRRPARRSPRPRSTCGPPSSRSSCR